MISFLVCLLMVCNFFFSLAVVVFRPMTRVSTGIVNCRKLLRLPKIWTNYLRLLTTFGRLKKEAKKSSNHWDQMLSPEIIFRQRYDMKFCNYVEACSVTVVSSGNERTGVLPILNNGGEIKFKLNFLNPVNTPHTTMAMLMPPFCPNRWMVAPSSGEWTIKYFLVGVFISYRLLLHKVGLLRMMIVCHHKTKGKRFSFPIFDTTRTFYKV